MAYFSPRVTRLDIHEEQMFQIEFKGRRKTSTNIPAKTQSDRRHSLLLLEAQLFCSIQTFN
jgi:hypothetical protein